MSPLALSHDDSISLSFSNRPDDSPHAVQNYESTSQSTRDPFSIHSLCSTGYKSPDVIASMPNKHIRAFYYAQNDLLQSMSQFSPHPCLPQPPTSPSTREHRIRRAIIASNLCNAFLLFAQLYAFIASQSLSMLAVFVDASLDLVSGVVVAITHLLKTRKDKIMYPVGRARLEPLGVIAMACLMTAATLVTLEQSIGALAHGKPRQLTFSPRTAIILLSALAIKGCLFMYCRTVHDDSVQALAEDHFNDTLSNLVSVTTMFLAIHFVWWVDPLGAIFISTLIIRNWGLHTFQHCDRLLGRVASARILNLITFIACNHSPQILLVDTVRAYHVGSRVYTEVHVVLDASMPLTEAHDIGESLQLRIENIEEVERCFVHLDIEADHSPDAEHQDV